MTAVGNADRELHAKFVAAGLAGVAPGQLTPSELDRVRTNYMVTTDHGTGRLRLNAHGLEVLTGVDAMSRYRVDAERFTRGSDRDGWGAVF